MPDGIKIGELAAQCGVSRDTIRFYEREGLLPRPRRTSSGHRSYDSKAINQLRFIRGARRLGLTLEDIGELLRLRERRGAQASRQIARRLRVRAEAIEAEIGKLHLFRELLGECIRVCERSPSRAAAILDRLLLREAP
jgi:MerR family copper efflux transcriptional regulator